MVENGTLLQHRFLIDECIGKGGMGAVYIATDQKFGSRVAIKETFYEDAELAEAFAREARLLNALHHPILPHVSDYFYERDGYFLVMEYIEGEDLSEVLKREGVFPVNDVVRWTLELLDGLDYLHSQEPPVIHRDIKPHNLKLTSRGNVVLLDFGLAKETSGNTLGVKSVFGYSRRYSPLEQIQGVGTDARSDIFSLGATVFHLITGKQPIDVLARASAIVAGKPDPLQLVNDLNPEVSSSLANVIATAMALNSDMRFATADAMKNALEDSVHISDGPAAEMFSDVVASVPVATNESFAALDAFKEDVEEASDDNEVLLKGEPEVPDEPVGVVKIPIGRQQGSSEWQRTAAWLTLAAMVLTVVAFGFLRPGSTDLQPQSDGPNSDGVEMEAVATEPVSITNQSAVSPKKENAEVVEVTSRETKSVPVKREVRKPDTEIREPEESFRNDEGSQESIIKRQKNKNRRPSSAQRRERFAQEPQFREPPVITIETIFTGLPNQMRKRRQRPEY